MNKGKFILIRADNTYEVVELNPRLLQTEAKRVLACDDITSMLAGTLVGTRLELYSAAQRGTRRENRLAAPFAAGEKLYGDVLMCAATVEAALPDKIVEAAQAYLELIQESVASSERGR